MNTQQHTTPAIEMIKFLRFVITFNVQILNIDYAGGRICGFAKRDADATTYIDEAYSRVKVGRGLRTTYHFN